MHISAVPPKIVPFPLADEPSQMDQYITLSCTISDGDLPLNIFWTFNGQPVTSELNVMVAKLGKRSSVLTIESVLANHAGNYTCHGENAAGATTYTAELKVIGLCILCILDRNALCVINFYFLFSLFDCSLFFLPTILIHIFLFIPIRL